MFTNVQEVATKSIVDFVMNQFKEQDAGGLFGYSRGVAVFNLALRVYHIHRLTDPREMASFRDYTSIECEKEQAFVREFTEFVQKHGKIQGYKVTEDGFIPLD